jgi:hypothetical protein
MAERYISFSSGFIQAEGDAEGHPNEMKFRGVLVKLDVPSDRPPNGSEGHRILLPKDVAQNKLKTLIGMGLNYDPDLDAHAPRRKVGVVQNAYIQGNDLWVEGVIWKHDFPEAQKDLKRTGLGMSMEVNQVQIKDCAAKIWEIENLCFLGGTILRKDAAAYHDTRAIAAARADVIERRNMSTTKKQTAKTPGSNGRSPGNGNNVIDINRVARVAAKEVAASTEKGTEEILNVLNAQTPILASIAASLETLKLSNGVTAAKGKSAQAADDDDDDEMTAKGKGTQASRNDDDDDDDDNCDDDDDDDDMDASQAIDDANNGNLPVLDDNDDDDEGKPGHINENIDQTGKGSNTTVDDKVGKTVSRAVSSAREKILSQQVLELQKQLKTSSRRTDQLEAKLSKVGTQVQAAAADTTRRSAALPADITALLSKANVDGRELQASGNKLTVDQADGILAAFEQSTNVKLDAVKRIQIKNQLSETGLLDDGRISR